MKVIALQSGPKSVKPRPPPVYHVMRKYRDTAAAAEARRLVEQVDRANSASPSELAALN